jgi:hypothetical protein
MYEQVHISSLAPCYDTDCSKMFRYSYLETRTQHSLETTELLIAKDLNLELITTEMTSPSQCT